jgi:hypothetical protein
MANVNAAGIQGANQGLAQFIRDNANYSTVIRVYRNQQFICQSVPNEAQPPSVSPDGSYLDFPSSIVHGAGADVVRLSLENIAYVQHSHPNIDGYPNVVWLEIFFWT